MTFTKKPLKWTALGQEPSELKKSEGFKMDESPAPGHFDFMFRSTYEAIEELQQKAGEVKTINNIQPDVNGNVLIPLPDTSKLYQKPTSGIPKTDLESSVQLSLVKADDAAPTTELAKTNQALATHKADNVSHDTYVTCATSSATAEKVVTATDFTLVEGARITVKFANANTATTPTLKINTEVAKPIVKADGTAFKNIKAGVYSFVYSGLNFTVQGEGGEYGTATASDVLVGKTIGTENGVVPGTLTLSSIGGVKFASGTVKSSTSSVQFQNLTNPSLKYDFPFVTVNNIGFTPSKIILNAFLANQQYLKTTYEYQPTYKDKHIVQISNFANNNTVFAYVYAINGSALPAAVSNGSFTLPVGQGDFNYEWIAYE